MEIRSYHAPSRSVLTPADVLAEARGRMAAERMKLTDEAESAAALQVIDSIMNFKDESTLGFEEIRAVADLHAGNLIAHLRWFGQKVDCRERLADAAKAVRTRSQDYQACFFDAIGSALMETAPSRTAITDADFVDAPHIRIETR